jgi:hypothetical protein
MLLPSNITSAALFRLCAPHRRPWQLRQGRQRQIDARKLDEHGAALRAIGSTVMRGSSMDTELRFSDAHSHGSTTNALQHGKLTMTVRK